MKHLIDHSSYRMKRKMALQVMWSGWNQPLLEHLCLMRLADRITAGG